MLVFQAKAQLLTIAFFCWKKEYWMHVRKVKSDGKGQHFGVEGVFCLKAKEDKLFFSYRSTSSFGLMPKSSSFFGRFPYPLLTAALNNQKCAKRHPKRNGDFWTKVANT